MMAKSLILFSQSNVTSVATQRLAD